MRAERASGPIVGSPSPDDPVFEVSFWSRCDGLDDVPEDERGYQEEPWHVRDADIDQVLAWARAEVGDSRTFTIYLAPYEHEGNHQPSRWLYGINPTIPTNADGGTYTLATPELVDDPRLDLFVLPPRLNRYRRRQRWIHKAERLRSAVRRSARITRRLTGR